MSSSSVTDMIIEQKIKALRDEGRPALSAVVEALRRIFSEVIPDSKTELVQDGPDTWIWKDMTGPKMPKYYVLTGSADEEVLGYPLLTIRQIYSPHLDSAVTVSCLVSGRTEGEIMQCVSLLVAAHWGAFSGLRYAMNASIANGGSARAAMSAAKAVQKAAEDQFTSVMKGDIEREVTGDESLLDPPTRTDLN